MNDKVICPIDSNHTIVPTTRDQPPNFGNVTWYDCNECGLSFAVGFEWPEDHPKWSEDLDAEK